MVPPVPILTQDHMDTPQSHHIKNRFDTESALWETYHLGGIRSIVAREIVQRKRLTKRDLTRTLGGQASSILEIGCGTGANLQYLLKEQPLWTAKGVDISPGMIEASRSANSNPHLSFDVLDIESETLNESFDAIILLGVFGYFSDTEQALKNIMSMLKPGGRLIFTYGNKHSIFRRVRTMAHSWPHHKITNRFGNAVRRLLKKPPVALGYERSHFQNLQPAAVRRLVRENATITQEIPIAFSTGLLGPFSVAFSIALELAIKKDRLDQAFTKLIIAQKD